MNTTPGRFERRANHTYYLDGQKLPGVTTILSAGLPAPALVNWAAEITATYAVDNWDELTPLGPVTRYERMRQARWKRLKAAALRGTEIHDLARGLILGVDVEVPDEHRGPVEALAALMDKLDMRPLLRETPVLNEEHRWAGTIDVTAHLGDDPQVWLLDYKTGKGLYEKDALQVSAYANATAYLDYQGELDIWRKPDRVGLVHITPDSAELHEVHDVERNYRTFRHVATVAAWLGHIKENPPIGEAL